MTKEFRKTLEQAGWTLIRRSKHLIYACPCGHALLTCPATPSDHRSLRNTESQFRRLARTCAHVSTEV